MDRIRWTRIRRVAQATVLALIITTASTASGGPAEVTWRARELQLSLRLGTDGRYTFQSPAGTSTGMYRIQGGVLVLHDDASGAQTAYGFSQPNDHVLLLTDPAGTTIRMVATERGGTGASDRPTASGGANATVLARSGGRVLTTADLQPAIRLIELVIDARLTPSERRRLRDAAVTDFQAQPEAFLQQVAELRRAMDRLSTLTDPFQLGLARQMLFAQLHFATRGVPPEQAPEIVKILHEHVRIVAEDPAAQLVLTGRDVEALVAYDQFLEQVTGVPALGLAGYPHDALEAQLAAGFAALPLQVKQTLAAIYPVWQATEYSWRRLTGEQRRMVALTMRQQLAMQWQQQPSSGAGAPRRAGSSDLGTQMMMNMSNARLFSSLLDTAGGFTACLTCSPGINPFK